MPFDEQERRRGDRALIELCHDRGLAHFEVEDLCRMGDVEPHDLHDHYDDLEDVFCDVYEREMERMFGIFEAAQARYPTWRGRLRATAYELYGGFRDDRALAHFLTVEVQSAGDRAVALLWQGVERMFELLDQGRTEMDDPSSISRATAESVAGGIFSVLVRTITTDEWPPPREIVPEAMYVAVLPYLGEGAAEDELTIAPPPGFRDGEPA